MRKFNKNLFRNAEEVIVGILIILFFALFVVQLLKTWGVDI